MPSSRRTVAGAGLGSRPWALRTVPVPVATADARDARRLRAPRARRPSRRCRRWRRARRPRGSAPGRADGGAARTRRAASARKTASARAVTRAGRAASSMSDAIAPWVRTTTSSPLTMAPGAGDAAAEAVLEPRSQPGRARRSSRRAHLLGVGARVDERAQGHVARDAGEAVEPGDRLGPTVPVRSREKPGDGAGGAVAVVDADHGDPRRAGGEHGRATRSRPRARRRSRCWSARRRPAPA